MNKSIAIIGMVFAVSAAWATLITDDFNRTDVALTTDTSLIGANWVQGNSADDQWGIASGQLVNSASSPGILVNNGLTMSSGSGDSFVFSAMVKPVQADRWMGVVFNYQDASNYYLLRFKTGDNAYHMLKNVGGLLTYMSGGGRVANENFALGTTYTLSITSDTAFDYWPTIDGGTLHAVGHAIDGTSAIASGYAGVYVGANGVGADFDNFSLEAIPEPATLGMVGLVATGMLFIRRRFMI